MVTVEGVLSVAASILGVAGILAVVVSVAIFARTKGLIDAQALTAKTYKDLYEAQAAENIAHREENTKLREQLADMRGEIADLRGELRGRDTAAVQWARHLLEAQAQSGVCKLAWTCANRQVPEIEPVGELHRAAAKPHDKRQGGTS